MKAIEVFAQNDGEVTKAYYSRLSACGILGEIGVALFRGQKRSSRAKDYRRGKWRRAAYDVKQWSIDQVCSLLKTHAESQGFTWGWKQDAAVVFGEQPSWVIYVDIPKFGQCSFHSPNRGSGPDYPGEWDRSRNSAEVILQFCDSVMATEAVSSVSGGNR